MAVIAIAPAPLPIPMSRHDFLIQIWILKFSMCDGSLQHFLYTYLAYLSTGKARTTPAFFSVLAIGRQLERIFFVQDFRATLKGQ